MLENKTDSKTTDKLEILAILASKFAGQKVTCSEMTLTWEHEGDTPLPIVIIKGLKID